MAFFRAARERGCSAVRAVTAPVNEGSIASHRRLGFEFEPGDVELDGIPVAVDYDGAGQHRARFTKTLGADEAGRAWCPTSSQRRWTRPTRRSRSCPDVCMVTVSETRASPRLAVPHRRAAHASDAGRLADGGGTPSRARLGRLAASAADGIRERRGRSRR
jgi:hypothetical protein